ncbi:phage portal protein [Frigidibacter sp.]|uniref:phage portal protein n=1 Tax=Frigidibacter sp. TaxID=2586418 RepID=UPI002733E836|nr:phage portal protein [Frigidibacter sp.]MDP3341497.1 phage portal protein [Frigidibacter sp.]
MAFPFRNPFRRRDGAPMQTRRFDGAAGGRRGFGIGSFGRVGSETVLAGPTLRNRARYQAANNPWIANATANIVGAMVGAGIEPTGNPDAVAYWNVWADSADAEGRTDVRGLVAAVVLSMIVDGEAVLQIIDAPEGPRVRLIPAELLDEAMTRELSDGRFIVSGVEFNADGTRAAYYILPNRPTDVFATTGNPIRVPASEILHIYKPIGAGQVRGVSWLASIILPANELDQLVDALAMGAKVAAMFAGFITNQNAVGGDDPFDGESQPSLEPGTLVRLGGGWDIKFAAPGQVQQVEPLLKHGLRQLAAGLGIPSHMLDGDLSDANYSSLRAGLLPFRQRMEQVQYHVLVPQLLNPIWNRVVAHGVVSGEIAAPDYETNPRAYRAEWIMPAAMQVDPQKQVNADIAELKAGLTSRRKLVAQRGWALADLDAELQAEGWKPEAKSNG